MPNHITNVLQVRGKIDLVAFAQKAVKVLEDGKQDFSLQSFLPMPKELNDTRSPAKDTIEDNRLARKYGAGNWYDWHVKFWGTKWDCYEVRSVERFPKFLKYEFLTAWSPPWIALMAISQMYPTGEFRLRWRDEGENQWHFTVFRAGTLTEYK